MKSSEPAPWTPPNPNYEERHIVTDLSPTQFDQDAFVLPSDEAMEILRTYSQAIYLAPMLTFFRRYSDHQTMHGTHRVIAMTMDFYDVSIAQHYKSVVDEMHDYVLGMNLENRSYTWAQLPKGLQQRILQSSLLPIEFLTEGFMDTHDTEFRLVMTENMFQLVNSLTNSDSEKDAS